MSGVLLAGCAAVSASLPLPTVGDGKITVPNVFGMSKTEAVAALRRAGYQGDITDESGRCGSVVDGHIIELDHVCAQAPSAGAVQGARVPISLRVQDEDPWHGNVGNITEWYLMPPVVGMSVDAARAELVRTGFRNKERAKLVWVDQPGCKPLTVCETYPEAMNRAGVNSDVLISVAQDPAAAPPPVPGDHASSTQRTAQAPRTPGAPKSDATHGTKPDPTPQPFF